MYKAHRPKADIDTLHAKRKEDGRGLLQIKATYKAEVINTADYLNTKYIEDQSVNIVRRQRKQTNK